MHQGNRPRDLRDISHLYLSKKNEKGEAAAGSVALVLAASLGGGPLRAWLSSGLAAAFGSQNAEVTLIDTGRSLPNAGYYFALGPDRYLRPVLDASEAVEMEPGRRVRVVCSRDPDLARYLTGSPAGGLKVIIVAFEWRGRDAGSVMRSLSDSLSADVPAFLLTLSDSCPGSAGGILSEFRDKFPGGPALALYPGVEGARDGGIEQCPFPAEMLEGLSRRKPPASTFLTGLAGEILQRLGSRKKGAARDRTG
jgi:hypothetical protein